MNKDFKKRNVVLCRGEEVSAHCIKVFQDDDAKRASVLIEMAYR
jgi:hypothetical protein